MAASRIVGALTADRLYYRHMRAFIERNQDVNYSKPVIFYLLPVRRLVAASVLSGGLFELYWLYKNWKAVREDAKDNEIRPAVYGWLLGPFFVWPLFKIIRINLKRSKTEGKRFVPPAVGGNVCRLGHLSRRLGGRTDVSVIHTETHQLSRPQKQPQTGAPCPLAKNGNRRGHRRPAA